MGMSRNEAYLYAKGIRRKHYTNQELEQKMKAQGHTYDDYTQVKWWLSHKPAGI